MARALVVGGAGYIGSSVTAWLLDRGHQVWVLDDLSRGHRELILTDNFTLCRCGDRETVRALLGSRTFDCVLHFAGFTLVSESVSEPEVYWENNVLQTRILLQEMFAKSLTRIVFSSSCAVYGSPSRPNMDESTPINPVSPYGENKWQVETDLAALAARGLKSISLRYFNAAGAESRLRCGEWHEPESHLIPNVVAGAMDGTPIPVFGADYPTPDGTCVRDYIHVSDLAAAHEAAMLRLVGATDDKGWNEAYNLGNECGFSIREIIQRFEQLIGKKVITEIAPRRPGDPPRLVADSTLARKVLGFKPTPQALDWILTTAHDWECKRRQMKAARAR